MSGTSLNIFIYADKGEELVQFFICYFDLKFGLRFLSGFVILLANQ